MVAWEAKASAVSRCDIYRGANQLKSSRELHLEKECGRDNLNKNVGRLSLLNEREEMEFLMIEKKVKEG